MAYSRGKSDHTAASMFIRSWMTAKSWDSSIPVSNSLSRLIEIFWNCSWNHLDLVIFPPRSYWILNRANSATFDFRATGNPFSDSSYILNILVADREVVMVLWHRFLCKYFIGQKFLVWKLVECSDNRRKSKQIYIPVHKYSRIFWSLFIYNNNNNNSI